MINLIDKRMVLTAKKEIMVMVEKLMKTNKWINNYDKKEK